MSKWKDWSKTEKIMMVIIVLLIIGIITRWGYVRREVSSSVNHYFSADSTLKAK